MITTRSLPVVAAGLLAVCLFTSAAAAQPPSRISAPPVPPALEVPPGHSVFLKGYAIGTQNYICLLTATGSMSWEFIGPEATLFITFNGDPVRQNATHYFSANPFEIETFRPTWQHSGDSSRVWGRGAAASSDPNFVEAGAVDWLLVEAVGTQPGPTGGTTLAQTTFIHRLNTSGGRKPDTGCSVGDPIGALKFVPYVAEYYFYRAD
jgi:hypothetical protein